MKGTILRIVASAVLVLAISVAYGINFSGTAEAGGKHKKAKFKTSQSWAPKASKSKGGKFQETGGPNLFWD